MGLLFEQPPFHPACIPGDTVDQSYPLIQWHPNPGMSSSISTVLLGHRAPDHPLLPAAAFKLLRPDRRFLPPAVAVPLPHLRPGQRQVQYSQYWAIRYREKPGTSMLTIKYALP